MPPPPYGVCRIGITGKEGLCGCGPCCLAGGSVQIEYEDSPPQELRDIFTPEQWHSFTSRYKAIVKDTTCSTFPFMWFAMFFPPCICVHCCCRSRQLGRRVDKLEAFISEENVRLRQQGLEWHESNPLRVRTGCARIHAPYGQSFEMRWIPGVRERWEAANPTRRKISQEPYPMQLLTDSQRAQVSLNQIAMALTQQQQPVAPYVQAQYAQAPYAGAGYPVAVYQAQHQPSAPGSQSMEPGRQEGQEGQAGYGTYAGQ
jgi:hypothetical protein